MIITKERSRYHPVVLLGYENAFAGKTSCSEEGSLYCNCI